jgi:hypothetical protein
VYRLGTVTRSWIFKTFRPGGFGLGIHAHYYHRQRMGLWLNLGPWSFVAACGP